MDMTHTFDRSGQVAKQIWSPAWLQRRPRPVRIAIRTVAIVVLTIFLLWLILFITKGRFLKGPFENVASAYTNREVTVGGDFNLYFDPLDIHFKAENLAISNPEWARDDNFFSARLIDTHIGTIPLIFGTQRFRWINLDGGKVALEYDASGKHNTWTFDESAKPKPLRLPEIVRGSITRTSLAYIDPKMQLTANIDVDTVKAKDTAFDSDIRFSGDGTIRRRPFTLSGSLMSPNDTVAGGRNKLALHAEAARTTLDVSGTLPGPTEFVGADLQLGVRGYDIANLFDFLGVAVPNTRAYRLNSALTYDGEEWKFTGLKGVFGDSDLAGSLRIGMPNNRLKLTADLRTNTLDIVDAGPFIGYSPQRLDAMGADGAIVVTGGRPRVLPDAPLRIEAISRFDADVRYRVARVRAESFPLSDIDLTLDLDHSLLELKPLKANLASGNLLANISLNARDPAVRTIYDIRLSPTPMGRLLKSFGAEQSGTSGTIGARVSMNGTGDSVRESLANSNGRIALVMPAGTFWTRNIQLAELDIGTFVQKMFEKKLKDPVQINCGLIAFTVRNGVAAADPILIDTKKNVITGRGGFSFRDESLDLAVRADAKTFSLFSAQSPVGVDGYFAAPRIDPISGELLTRAGAGIGLAVVATPIAGLLAFIDPGDAKAAQCGPVLSGARASAQRTSKGKPREDVGSGGTKKPKDKKRD
jgi:AsmA family protein